MSARPSLAATTSFAAAGDCLCSLMHKLPSDRCRWRGQDDKKTRHYLVNCEAWKPQIQELWEGVGKFCGWKHPRAPGAALLFDGKRAAKAILSFGKRRCVWV